MTGYADLSAFFSRLALVRNAPPVTLSRLPFAESRKPLVRVRLAGSHGPVDPGHRTARQRGLIVVIFDPAPLVRAPAQQTKARGSSIQGVAGGGADRLAHWDGRSDFPPAQPAESVTQRPFPESREPAHAGGICGLSCAGRSAPAAGSFGRDVATAGLRVK